MKLSSLFARGRAEPGATAKRVCMAVARDVAGASFGDVAERYGVNMSSAWYAQVSVRDQAESDPSFQEEVQRTTTLAYRELTGAARGPDDGLFDRMASSAALKLCGYFLEPHERDTLERHVAGKVPCWVERPRGGLGRYVATRTTLDHMAGKVLGSLRARLANQILDMRGKTESAEKALLLITPPA